MQYQMTLEDNDGKIVVLQTTREALDVLTMALLKAGYVLTGLVKL